MQEKNMQDKMCEMCGMRPATVFFKKTINGVTTEKSLCQHCASAVNQTNLFDEVFGDNFYSAMFGMAPHKGMSKLRVCPKCGTSERDVLENYRFGCSECYEAFRDIASQYVSKLGGKVYHGQPAAQTSAEPRPKQASSPQSELQRLERLKQEAIDKEDYLTAQSYYEQIRNLQNKG